MRNKLVLLLLLCVTVNATACQQSDEASDDAVVTEENVLEPIDEGFGISYDITDGMRKERPDNFYPDEEADGVVKLESIPALTIGDIKLLPDYTLDDYLNSGLGLDITTLTVWNKDGIPANIDKQQLDEKLPQGCILEVNTVLDTVTVQAKFKSIESSSNMYETTLVGYVVQCSDLVIDGADSTTPKTLSDSLGITEFVGNNTVMYSISGDEFSSLLFTWNNEEPYNLSKVEYVSGDIALTVVNDIKAGEPDDSSTE